MNKTHWPKLILALIVPQCAGFIGSIFTRESVATWYQGLVKPTFSPPGWIFAPVWISLYFLMGLAFYFVLVSIGDNAKRRTAVVLFCVQLAVNTAWSYLFFGLHSPFWAFIDIIVLWAMITFLIRVFWGIDRLAGAMLVPYWLWVSFAGLLNYGIWMMN